MRMLGILYIMALSIVAILSIVFFKNEWPVLGIMMGLTLLGGILAYLDIRYLNKQKSIPKKSRRAQHFSNLDIEEREEHIITKSKELEQKIKKIK